MIPVAVSSIHRLPDGGNLKGFATVQVGPWTVRGLRIIQQLGQRAYVALPQTQSPDGRYWPVLQTSDSTLKDAIQAAVLTAWAENDHENSVQ